MMITQAMLDAAAAEKFCLSGIEGEPWVPVDTGVLRALIHQRDTAREQVRERDAELLRVRTTGHGAAHAIDNLAIELGMGANVEPIEIARRIRVVLAAAGNDLKDARAERDLMAEAMHEILSCPLPLVPEHGNPIDKIRGIARDALSSLEQRKEQR